MTQLLDDDPVETREWLDSLQAVLRHQGGKRAAYLIDELTDEARRAGLAVALDLNTPYVNTIPLERKTRLGSRNQAPHSFDYSLERGRNHPAGQQRIL